MTVTRICRRIVSRGIFQGGRKFSVGKSLNWGEFVPSRRQGCGYGQSKLYAFKGDDVFCYKLWAYV